MRREYESVWCLCARAVGWVEVGLIALILSLPLFLCLLRFWDDCTDKQQTTGTGYRPADKCMGFLFTSH